MLFLISFYVFVFDYLRLISARYIPKNNTSKKSRPSYESIDKVNLFSHSIRVAVFIYFFSTDAIFDNIFINTVYDFVQVVWFGIAF